jgi:NtrC-family two-component system sensor histidine kinase KinB
MSPFSAVQLRRAEQRFALTVVLALLAGGFAWVLLTDLLLYALARDAVVVARFETAKGWLFVVGAALLIYPVLRRSAARLTRAQATLAAVVDSIADGVLLLGRDRTIVHANPAALRILRCDELKDLVGVGADEFSRRFKVSHPDGSVVPPAQYVSQRVFDEGGPLKYKAVLHPPGGRDVIVSVTAAPVRRTAGERAERVVSVMHDITETERLEDLRAEFFAAAAHALKTPLTIVKASAQLVSDGATPRVARSVGAIERQCHRMERLVDNLLAVARARSGTLRLYPTTVDLGGLVEEVAREMSRASRKHEVRAEVTATPSVHADQERLAMVLRNMIDVADRSSEDGTPIVVRLTQDGHDAAVGVCYQVQHPEEGSSDVGNEYDDLGISRYVTATIVEAHGGALRDERVGSEVTSWFRLPALGEDRHGPA